MYRGGALEVFLGSLGLGGIFRHFSSWWDFPFALYLPFPSSLSLLPPSWPSVHIFHRLPSPKMKPPALLLALATTIAAAPGDGDWAAAYTKAKTALAKLSTNEKVGMVTGVGWQKGPCVGNTGSAGSIKFPALCLQDGPLG